MDDAPVFFGVTRDHFGATVYTSDPGAPPNARTCAFLTAVVTHFPFGVPAYGASADADDTLPSGAKLTFTRQGAVFGILQAASSGRSASIAARAAAASKGLAAGRACDAEAEAEADGDDGA